MAPDHWIFYNWDRIHHHRGFRGKGYQIDVTIFL